MNPEWLANYRPISAAFMEYGWFVAPFMIGAEFKTVRDTADYISQHPPQNEQERRDIESRIYHALVEPVFHSEYRARASWYGNQLNHLKDFNHLYESAIFSYYKREYPQAVLCLLSALEGVMLSFYGYSISSSVVKPSIPSLIEKIATTSSPFLGTSAEVAHDMYRDTLVRFLQNWLYKNTNQSDFTLSVLNRHYVLHGMDAGNFYRPQDLHRLILAFDLLIEFLSIQQRVFHNFLPDVGEDDFIDLRRIYYNMLARGIPTIAESWKIERKLLKQHTRYVVSDHDPNIVESLMRSAALMAKLTEMANSAKKGNNVE